jgi:O-antigen biosynthesis protein
VLLGDVLEHLRDPLASLRQAVRKLKPSGFIVTSLPNVAHGDVRLSLMQGRFRYADVGLLDRTHIKFFTLETARELITEAGLFVADTKRVIVPLFMSELGLAREDFSHDTVNELLTDPEAETYQFVMKSVRDNGTRTLAELSRRVNELSDRDSARAALLRKDLYDSAERIRSQNDQLQEQALYIEALKGHASGLEHNVDLLNDALTASESARASVDAQYRAVLGMKTVQMTAPIRWLYRKIARNSKKSP